jgi:hypothetical protein
MKRVNQLWEVKWERSGVEVDEAEFLWVLARSAAAAAGKAAKFLRKKNGKAKVTGVSQHGTIDVF